MAEFYVTKENIADTGYQLHLNTCEKLPPVDTLRYLGSFAVRDAAFNKANGFFAPVTDCPCCLGSR